MKLYTTSATIFKKNSTRPAAVIPTTHKLEIGARREFTVLAYNEAGDSHWSVTFDRGLGPNNWNTWCVFKGHVALSKPEKPGDYEPGDHLHISDDGLSLIKKYEGFRGRAYLCPAGVWTIGYGSTHGVKQGQTITEPQAVERLRREVQIYERAVLNCLSVTPTQNQFDALVSLCYNIGGRAIARSSVVKLHNRREFARAADAFLLWNRGGGKVLAGLTRRRQEERELYLR